MDAKILQAKRDVATKLLENNQWSYIVFGHKSIFVKHSYIENKNGYGDNVYSFNIQTVANDIRHVVAPKTVLFYRETRTTPTSGRITQPYSNLFDFAYFAKEFPLSNSSRKIKPARQHNIISFLKKIIKRIPIIKSMLINISPKNETNKIPNFVLSAWLEANSIETQLFPYEYQIQKLEFYNPTITCGIDEAYTAISKKITHNRPDYIFIVPGVIRGGADKVLINYCKAIQEKHPEWNISVISTSQGDNVWAGKLPSNTSLIDFGNISSHLSYESRELLLTRIITQLRCRNIHIINSDFAFLWCLNYLDLIEKNYKVSASLFCHDIVKSPFGNGIFSYADPYIVNIQSAISYIFTDNRAVIDDYINKNGLLNDNKFKVHYQPVDLPTIVRQRQKTYNANQPLRVLWASRVSLQKYPEMVIQIANMMDEREFKIDIYGKLSSEYSKEQFSGINSLEYKGEFNGINSINVDDYDVFLYTSKIDGLPNILLEIASTGLPIIASDVGGIGEFIINKKTGLLVEDFNSPSEYIKALKFVKNNPEKCAKYTIAAQELLKTRHSFQSFSDIVDRDFST